MSTQTTSKKDQYTLWQILGIWMLSATPMGLLSWVVFPAVLPDFNSDPLEWRFTTFASFFGRDWDWFKHAWGTIRSGCVPSTPAIQSSTSG